MPLTPGSRLGHYDVTALIGEGGMGQVYQATDTKLNRQVALKILPEAFATDPDRLARFQREAQVLASLNHPNIAQIHGIEEQNDTRALVLELVEGPTLADRIAQGPIPVDEALPIAKQIAEALEAAHEAGVIHRDLKPANIKVREDGTVKVLDFGLAKALDTTPQGDPSQSPTLTAAATQMGVIMGTAAYMSPEQAIGAPTDRSADVWAAGLVLFEMLTGERVFTGDTVSHVLASVLKVDPDWEQLPPETPRGLRRLLRRCLDKNAKQRLRDIRELRIRLEHAAAGSSGEVEDSGRVNPPMSRNVAVPWLIAAVATIATVVVSWNAGQAPRSDQLFAPRANVSLAAGHHVQTTRFTVPFAISPNGRWLVYVAEDRVGRSQLCLRDLGELETVAIPGTEGAEAPFFSPDSQWIGFLSGRVLMRASVAGGAPFKICDAPAANNASWSVNDEIVFDVGQNRLFIVAADGGEPRLLLAANGDRGERQVGTPHFLPDGSALLFHVWTDEGSRLGVLWPETGERRILPQPRGAPWNAKYAASGHLVYSDGGRIMAAPFDPVQMETTGPAVQIVEEALWTPGVTGAYFSVAEAGAFAYLPPSPVPDLELVWVDREGRATPLVEDRATYMYPRLSHDDRRVAVTLGSDAAVDLWVIDVDGGGRTMFSATGEGIYPVWSPNDSQLGFSSSLSGPWNVFVKGVGEVGEGESLITSQLNQQPTSWVADGTLSFLEEHPMTGDDIWVASVDEGPTPRAVLNTPFQENNAAFSPNGSWLAYSSDRSGRDEVWVQRFPSGDDQQKISDDGGSEPVWSWDGRELFYRSGSRMMVVSVQEGPPAQFGRPQRLFEQRYEKEPFQRIPDYDVAGDGQFVMVRGDDDTLLRHFNISLGFFDELNRLAPGN